MELELKYSTLDIPAQRKPSSIANGPSIKAIHKTIAVRCSGLVKAVAKSLLLDESASILSDSVGIKRANCPRP